jgi:hypothetical protein
LSPPQKNGAFSIVFLWDDPVFQNPMTAMFLQRRHEANIEKTKDDLQKKIGTNIFDSGYHDVRIQSPKHHIFSRKREGT